MLVETLYILPHFTSVAITGCRLLLSSGDWYRVKYPLPPSMAFAGTRTPISLFLLILMNGVTPPQAAFHQMLTFYFE
jgi:hypothetical protein